MDQIRVGRIAVNHISHLALQTQPRAVPGSEAPLPRTVVSALVEVLSRLGVRDAFGVSGGAMAALWDALTSSSLGVYHFRHENGAAFAAIEASFASGRPTVLFTTTGPGLANAITGILAAREERARVIVVSRTRRPPPGAGSRSRRLRSVHCPFRCTNPGGCSTSPP